MTWDGEERRSSSSDFEELRDLHDLLILVNEEIEYSPTTRGF